MNAAELTGIYVDELAAKGIDTPRALKDKLGSTLKRLINEGKVPDDALAEAVKRLAAKGLSPGALPSLAVEVQLEMVRNMKWSTRRTLEHSCGNCGTSFATERRLDQHILDVHTDIDAEGRQAGLQHLKARA